MVRKIIHKGKEYFQCEACDMYYLDEEMAKKCEDFCNEKKACSIEVVKHAVELGD